MKKLHITANDVTKITLQDLSYLENKSHFKEVKNNCRILIEMSQEDESGAKAVQEYLDLLSEAVKHTVSQLRGLIKFYNLGKIKERFLETQQFVEKLQDLFPVPVYISAHGTDGDSIGILIPFEKGKIPTLFEGNDESTPETIAIVNKLLGFDNKEVMVYGSHSEVVVQKIKQSGILPKNIYVSPDRKYAEGFWGEDRVLFSGTINLGGISQESEKDWKTIQNVKIKNMKILN